MAFLELGLSLLGATTDTFSLSEALKARFYHQAGHTAAELFESCVSTAFKRIPYSKGADPLYADFDLEKLRWQIDHASDRVFPATLPSTSEDVVLHLAPLLAECITVQGVQDSTKLIPFTRRVAEAALEDFLTRLPLAHAALNEVDLAHIQASAASAADTQQRLQEISALLQALSAKQDEIREHSEYLSPTVIQQESSRPEHRNPFRVMKAEDFDRDYDRLAFLFHKPSDYEELRGPGNLIIEGGRGCGKSMILRSMSAQAAVQLERLKRFSGNPTPPPLAFGDSGLDYFGVYIKLASGYFYEWSPDSKLTLEKATQLFQHIFNMLLLRSLLDSLSDTRSKGLLDVPAGSELAIATSVEQLIVGKTSTTCKTFGELQSLILEEEHAVGQFVGDLRLEIPDARYSGHYTYIFDFLNRCCEILRHNVISLRNARVFFLLDEYENLDTFQQRIVNTLAKGRPSALALKIATRPLGVKSRLDLNNETLQRPRDYDVVPLDHNVNDKAYGQLLLEIARKRLNAEKYTQCDLLLLLQKAPPFHPATLESVYTLVADLYSSKHAGEALTSPKVPSPEELHRFGTAAVFRLCAKLRQPYTYAGFHDFVLLSSGIVSNFLELCKIAFYMAEGDGVEIRSGSAVPWQVQNRAVYATSQASFEWLARNIPETGPVISRLVNDLATVFKEKLLHHKSEPEAGRLSLHDAALLDQPTHAALARVLEDGVRWSVLHGAGAADSYQPKHKSEVRPDEYFLSRILGPILRISPKPRWRTKFSVAELEGLTSFETRTSTRTNLIRRHSGRTKKRKVTKEPDKSTKAMFPTEEPPLE